MDYHQNARLTIHSREQLASKVLLEKCTLKLAAASFNVSAKTAAKWVRRYRELGRAGLADRSSRAGLCPRSTAGRVRETVFSLRRLRYNGARIARELGLSRAPSAAFCAAPGSTACALSSPRRRSCATSTSILAI